MLDSSDLDSDIHGVVAELADSRQCIITWPARFEGRILELARTHGKGVTNIMGHLYHEVERSSLFNPIRKQQILHQLTLRGVGVAQPVLRRF